MSNFLRARGFPILIQHVHGAASRVSPTATPYLHASQLEIVQPHRTPRELFLVAATKLGYTFLSTCIGELEAVSSPSFGSAPGCAVQVLFVHVDERWQKRSCIPSVSSSYRIWKGRNPCF